MYVKPIYLMLFGEKHYDIAYSKTEGHSFTQDAFPGEVVSHTCNTVHCLDAGRFLDECAEVTYFLK